MTPPDEADEADGNEPAEAADVGARHALPFDDATVHALSWEARIAISDVWFRRAESELNVGAQFRLLAERFDEEPTMPELRASLARAIEDEHRHSRICLAVSKQYANAAREPSSSRVSPLVRFGTTTEEISLLLHLVVLSCVNEVTSTFYLRECMKRAESPLARAALRELLADDVQHARIGWTHLASKTVTNEARVHVSRALPTLLQLSHAAWSNVPARTEPWFLAHGCAGSASSRQAFEDAVREVVLPGMATVGVDAAPGEKWANEHLAGARGSRVSAGSSG